MKNAFLMTSLSWLLAACLLNAQPAIQPSRPVIPAEAKLTEKERTYFQSVMDQLAKIGLWERAKRMESDLMLGRIIVVEEEEGVMASTDWSRFGPNFMEIPKYLIDRWTDNSFLARGHRAKGRDELARPAETTVREMTLNMALTIDHEYIHMDQYRPSETTEHENPAWRRRLDQESRLIQEATDAVSKMLAKGVNSAEDRRTLETLRNDLRDIDQIHQGTVKNDLRAQVYGEKALLTPSLFKKDFAALDGTVANIAKLLKQADEALTMTEVPTVSGKTPDDAAAVIVAAGLSPAPLLIQGEVKNVKARVVFDQEPKAGTKVELKSAVKFYYSLSGSGKMTLMVPDVTKLTRTEAEAKLTDLKFKFDAKPGKKEPRRGNKRQEVYEQSPQPKTEASEGDKVTFTYLAGIEVGRYVGMNKDDAAKAILKAELRPKVSEGPTLTENEAERFNIYEQAPMPGEYVWFDDEVSVLHYKLLEGGFQDGDGNEVDTARLATAKVYSGGARELGLYPGADGKRCAILLTPAPSTNMMAASETWSIVKFADAAAAKAFYKKMAEPMTANQNMAGHKETLQRSPDGGVIYSRNMNMRGIKSSDHIRISIYRDLFIIMYAMHKPQATADVSHAVGIMQKSKDLVDKRFPKP